MNYFITGTDTGVGKTLVSCALLHAFAAQGKRVVGMKPVAAGCGEDGNNADVNALRTASTVVADIRLVNPYVFADAIAPHIAARAAGVTIEFKQILAAYRELASHADVVIVEGVGGFKVPLNELQDSAQLAQQLNLPVILVAGMRLGCLNHALLTVDAIKVSGLVCAGWVANVVGSQMSALAENIAALQQRITAPLLGVVPYQAQPDARVMAARLNIELLVKTSLEVS